MSDSTSQELFTLHEKGTKKITNGEELFEPLHLDIKALKSCIQESLLPLPSATQLTESKVKDVAFCESTSHSASSASNLAMVRSSIVPNAVNAVKNDDGFKNIQRRNDKAREHVCGNR